MDSSTNTTTPPDRLRTKTLRRLAQSASSRPTPIAPTIANPEAPTIAFHRSFEQISFHPQLGPQIGELARSSTVMPSRSPGSIRSWPTQFPNVPVVTPMLRATSAISRSSSNTIATASRPNSCEYFDGRPADRPSSACWTWALSPIEVSTQREDDHAAPPAWLAPASVADC